MPTTPTMPETIKDRRVTGYSTAYSCAKNESIGSGWGGGAPETFECESATEFILAYHLSHIDNKTHKITEYQSKYVNEEVK